NRLAGKPQETRTEFFFCHQPPPRRGNEPALSQIRYSASPSEPFSVVAMNEKCREVHSRNHRVTAITKKQREFAVFKAPAKRQMILAENDRRRPTRPIIRTQCRNFMTFDVDRHHVDEMIADVFR